jgi:hypothetical protein
VEWSSYVGGSGGESGAAVTLVDGDVVVVGHTTSDDLPVSGDAHGSSRDPGGIIGRDAYVVRLSSDGGERVYASYLGGSGEDLASGVALLPAGNVLVVAGQTDSSNFPGTSAAPFPVLGGGIDVFVARFDLDTGALEGATYLGGSGNDFPRDILVEPDGSIVILGDTSSPDFPATEAAGDGTLGGPSDLFVARFAPTGEFLGARFVGGSGDETGGGIERGPGGEFWLVGSTTSSDLPVDPGSTPGGGFDALVVRLSTDLVTVEAAALLGGSLDDRGRDVAVEPSGDTVVVFGTTESDDFPLSEGAIGVSRRERDLFVTKLSRASLGVTASTLFGTVGSDTAYGVRTDASGAVVLVASGFQGGAPTTPGAWDLHGRPQCSPYCFADALVARLNATLTTVQYASYLASSNGDSARGVTDTVGIHVVGSTSGADFPTTAGVFGEEFNLGTSSAAADAYAARLDLSSAMPVVSVSPVEVSWAPLSGSDGYDVVVGDLASLRSSGGDWTLAVDRCAADSTTSTSVELSDTPAPGQGLWVLVRTERAGTPTSYDAVGNGQRGTRDDGVRESVNSCPSG